MPTLTTDGISTRYEVIGSGPPLLMFSPGGFDARIEKWSDLGVYARIKLLEHLPKHFSCIVFDRRECGESGGRLERVTWDTFVRQAEGLLDALGHDTAHLIGGCMGCCPVATFAATRPERVRSMVFYFPVGGARYRINAHGRFRTHLAYLEKYGLAGVVDFVRSHKDYFGREPEGGPWTGVIRRDEAFARAFVEQHAGQYALMVQAMGRTLFDRDTAPGAEPEDLLRSSLPALIVPGADESHATSAARYLHECLPKSEYLDLAVDAQDESTVPPRIIEFLKVTG